MMNRFSHALSAFLFCCTVTFAQYPGSRYLPEVSGDRVRFEIKAPRASEVKLYGDFLPGVNEYGTGGSVAMEKQADGVWTYTASGLAPDFYFYYFEVDGVKVLDPWNLKLVCNYSEFYNSFLIEGEGSVRLAYAEKQGTVETRWYDSPEYGGQRRLKVYLPAAYSPERAYPVLYMIPGGGDDEATWIDMGRLPQIMDHMLAFGEIVPMIVVMVNAMPNQLAAPHVMNPIPGKKSHFELMESPEGASGGAFCDDFVRNIIPYVEKHYSVIPHRAFRAVCGVSMGGVYEMTLLRRNADLLGTFAFMGTGLMGAGGADALASVGKDWQFWIGVGSQDIAFRSAKNLMDALDRAGIPYTYYDSGEAHNWRSWRRNLQQLLPCLFR